MRALAFLNTRVLSVELVTSAPITQRADDAIGLTTRGNPGAIYLCTGPNWTGTCQYVDRNLITEGCTVIPSAFAHAQSIGGDQGPSCSVYSQPNWQGVTLDVTYPGTADASEANGWPGPVASFTCQFMYDPPA